MLSACDQAVLRSQADRWQHKQVDAIGSTCFPHFVVAETSLLFPLTARVCRCDFFLDVFGHHRSACAVSGVLGRRGFVVESVAARVCRETGARK